MSSESPQNRLEAHGRARDTLLARIVDALECDSRFAAAWLAGSLAAGTADAWSDVDLYTVVHDDDYEALIEQRQEFHPRFGEVVAHQSIDGRLNSENPGSQFDLLVYRGGIEVDWTLMPLSLAHRPPWSRLLFDRIGVPVDVVPPESNEERRARLQNRLDFFWAMAAVALKEVGRGYTTGAASTIQLMTGAFDTMWRLLYRPDQPHPERRAPRHRPPVPELQTRTPRLGREIDPMAALQVIRSLCREVEGLHPVLREKGVSIPEGMPREMAQLGDLAEAALSQPNDPP